nr:uncharacterized protein LOC118877915 [Drosophila suzukii]
MSAQREVSAPIQSLNITSYNIRGLEGKQNNKEFIKYLRNFNIYILLETHTLPNAPVIEDFEKQQPDFEFLHWKDATKVFRRGRGIGGCIIGIRKSLKEFGISHSTVESNGFKLLQLRMGDKKLNIVPLYIHTIGWDEEFEPVKKAFENKETPIDNVVVMGDVNIRIGEIKQPVEPNPCVANTNGRLSHDKKRKNGSKFLSFCADNKLQILNGLTHGDSEGSYTYFSAIGNSTIDLAAVSQNLMASVIDFKVDKPEEGQTRHESDHLPICLQMDLSFLRNSQVTRDLPIRRKTSNFVPFDSSIILSDSTLDSEIKVEEVIFALRHGSWPKFSKNAFKDIIGIITLRCNDLFNELKEKQIVGLNLLSTSDLLINILKIRLTKWCKKNKILSNSQIRFSGKSSKTDFVYNLSTMANMKLAEKGTKVYSYFVHFESISSEMLRTLLWPKLQKLGVSSKIIRFLRFIYEQREYREELLGYFQWGRGDLSALIFALYLNDLPDEFKDGILIDDRQISTLMYADKMAILSGSVSGLQNMINQLENYCIKWGCVVDMKKSEVMVFRRGARLSAVEKWNIKGQEIKTASNALFLDFEFTPLLSSTQQVRNMISNAKSRLEDFSSESEPWTRLMELYMAGVWGCKKFKELDSLQATFVRKTKSNCTNLNSLALGLHLKYIGKLYFSQKENSLAGFLTRKVMEKNILWAEQLNEICGPLKLKWRSCLNSELEWSDFCLNLISRLENP